MLCSKLFARQIRDVAARSGVQRATTFLYRAFCFDWSRDYLDDTNPPLSNNDAALPEFEWGKLVCDNNDCGKRLAFLLLPSKAGHTAADAARLAGYTDMAVWLENIVLLLDTDGEFKPLRDIPEVVEEAGWEHGENSLYR